MPDAAPPPVPEGIVCPPPQALTSEQIDTVLADFRCWLGQFAAAPAATENVADEPPAATPPDLHTLLGQFIALRHEVNLQTRTSRTQLEQNAEALRQLSSALESLQQSESAEAERQDASFEETLRPLLKTMVDVYDALALARREIQRVRDQVLPELERWRDLSLRSPTEDLESEQPKRSFWSRLLGRAPSSAESASKEMESSTRSASEDILEQSATHISQMLSSLLTGYTMSLQRIERTLQQYELEAIPTAGQPFDPERMEVVEVVTESGRATSEVIDEVRRGYLWQGRIFRFAQVRVARGE